MQRHGIENTVQVPHLSGLADHMRPPRLAMLGALQSEVNESGLSSCPRRFCPRTPQDGSGAMTSPNRDDRLSG